MARQGELPPSDVPSEVPRRLRRRNGPEATGCGLWFLRLFILPHTLIGLGLIGWVFVNFALLVAGTSTDAQVIAKSTGRGKNEQTYVVEYVFGENNRFHDKTSVNRAVYQRIALPDGKVQVEKDTSAPPPTIPIRYLSAGDLHYSQSRLGTGIWGVLGFSLVFATFWNAILSIFFYMAWIGPFVGNKLYRSGTVARGKITKKRVISGRPRRVKLTYEFETDSGQQVTSTMTAGQASRAESEAYVGQVVTVLYSPDRPNKSVLYEYGNYEVGGS